jgi:putative NADH-flavin reductase
MKIVLYGATGQSGSRILKELLSRGHTVTAVSRDVSKLPTTDGITKEKDDLSDVNRVAGIIKGADAVISAYAPPGENTDALIGVTRRLVEAVRKAGVSRLLVVGGAGGLEISPGVTLLDSGQLPEAWRPIASAHVRALALLRASDIDWTYIAPATFFQPGERTGAFRLGQDELISNDKGESRISMEDYAVALVDEIEKPTHRKQRFSVGY